MSTATLSIPMIATAQEQRDFAGELRKQTIAVRVRHEKLGTRKALSREQIKAAAAEFHADHKLLSASKRLIDTRDPAYRAVVSVRRRATQFWKSLSTPYPEPGTRLIRKDKVAMFEENMTSLSTELNAAVTQLQEKYDELRHQARQQLGDLFDESDYPSRIDGEFSLDWDFPSIEPPAYLKNIHPDLYQREVDRIRTRFEDAVRLTEEAFLRQFHELVAHLAERLSGDVDGKPKTFRDTAVTRLNEFFETFRQLDTGSNAALQDLVNKAQQSLSGVSPDDLRGSVDARSRVMSRLGEITQTLDELMVDRPVRAIDMSEEAGDGE